MSEIPISQKQRPARLPIQSLREQRRAIQNSGMHFTYVRVENAQGEKVQYGGLVLAWYMPDRGSNMLEVAASWCRPDEKFDRTTGRYTAMCRHLAGNFMPIRLPLKGNYSQQLRELFLPCLLPTSNLKF